MKKEDTTDKIIKILEQDGLVNYIVTAIESEEVMEHIHKKHKRIAAVNGGGTSISYLLFRLMTDNPDMVNVMRNALAKYDNKEFMAKLESLKEKLSEKKADS